jgi:hypothetical protein
MTYENGADFAWELLKSLISGVTAMRGFGTRSVFLFALAALALTALGRDGSAKADAIYNLTYDSCTGGCGNGQGTNNNSFGYVDLHQVSSTQVSVTLQLTDPAYFVNTGNGTNHAPFAFNVDQTVAISGLADASGTPSTFFSAGALNQGVSGLGSFTNEIACTNNCPNGASNGGAGNLLSFTVTGSSPLSLTDFVANSGGFFFAADIIGPSGKTGEVAANTAPTITGGGSTPVPEPSSLALLAGGLLGIQGLRRLRVGASTQRLLALAGR